MHERARSCFALAILLACCACAFALDPSLDISEYAHTSWKVRDGFVKGVITSLAQTPDGYLWLGTEFGLYRFDGVRALQWRPPAGQQLVGDVISALLAAQDGTLWIGTGRGLANWKNGSLGQIPEAAGIVTSLLQARDGTVWVTTFEGSGGKLCDIRNGVVHCEVSPAVMKALYEDSKGAIWVGLQNGVWLWKPGHPDFFSFPDEPIGIISLAEDEQGHLLVGTHAGIQRLMNGRFELYPSARSAFPWQVTRMFRDHDGALWVGTREHGVVHISEQGRTDVFSSEDGLSGDHVRRFLEDREGCIWVATFDGGLDRFREYAIPTITSKQHLGSSEALSLLATRDGSVWIVTTGALNRWKNGQLSLFGSRAGTDKTGGKLNGRPASSLFQDSSGKIWVANVIGEVGYVQDDRWIPIPGLPPGGVRAMAEAPSGHLWISNEEAGLIEVFQGRVQQQISWARFGHGGFARTLVADPSQRGLWLGFQNGGMTYLADSKIRASFSPSNGLGEGDITDLRFGADGALWAATNGGLSRIKDGRVTNLSTQNGLPCDRVVATAEDDDHSMWLNLGCAVARITRSELEGWIADSNKVVRTEIFDTYDGVRSHTASGGYQPLMARSADGRVWFLPWDGVSVIDPHHLPFNKVPPPVHIEKITADDKTVDVSNGMHLPNGVRHLDIDYTALSLVIPEKVRFRVKLEGEDNDWRELVNVRHVEYTNLPPQHYRFRVLASNNSGVWNEEGASLEFVIPPMWYQTNWFRSLCAAVFLALIWMLHQVRLRQQARQFNRMLEARVGERTRIARELHDTLLQSFHGLLLQFQATSQLLQPNSPVKQRLDTAIDQAANAIAESRKTVQGLRTSTVEGRDLGKAIRTVGEELASANAGGEATAFQVQGVGPRRDLRALVHDEVYRIAVEALRNAFQHAGAKRITVEIQYEPREFRLSVSDDGRGIDPQVLQGEGIKGHFGLPGMRERATIIGGNLDVWSSVGEGTEINLTIPGTKAYSGADERPWWSGKLRKEKDESKAAKTTQ